MAKLTNVEFYGTGGGCVLYSALVNDSAWIATDFESAFYYDENVELVDEDFLNGVPYEDHVKDPSEPLPTWKEIFKSIIDNVPDHVSQAELIMKSFDMNAVVTPNWEYPKEWHDNDE